MPQIYMIITHRARANLIDNISLLGSELISTVKEGFDLENKKDIAFTVPAPVLYTKKEAEVQIEIRYTAGEDEYGQGRPFDPSLKDQERLVAQIQEVFRDFITDHGLPPLTLSVWCKPYYNSVFKM